MTADGYGRIDAHRDVIYPRYDPLAFVGRRWLIEEVSRFRDDDVRRHLVIVGEPGSGKSTLLAYLAETWNCARHFVRADNISGVTGLDARAMLVSLGAQLCAKYGRDIFERVDSGMTHVRATWTKDQAEVVGRFIDELHTLPFLPPTRRDVKVDARLTSGEARVIGERVRRLVDVSLALDELTLLHIALLDPVLRVGMRFPGERVLVLIDALDEAREHSGRTVLDVIPRSGDPAIPNNLRLLATSRRGSHLVGMFNPHDMIDLDADDMESRRVRQLDARDYIERRLAEPPLAQVVERLLPEQVSEFVDELATQSDGNFLFLFHLLNAAGESIAQGTTDLRAIPLPKDLDDIYRVFAVGKIRQDPPDLLRFTLREVIPAEVLRRWRAIRSVQHIEVRDTEVLMSVENSGQALQELFPDATDAGLRIENLRVEPGLAPGIWEQRFLPVLGVLAVAFEPLNREQLAVFSRVDAVYVDAVVFKLQQFLDVRTERDGNRFGIYHSSFAEYLLSGNRNRDVPIDGRSYHRQIAKSYLGDELDVRGANWARPLDHYASRYLCAHLRKAGERGSLFSLVDLRTWYDAQMLRVPAGDAYLSDLSESWAAAEEFDEARVRETGAAPLLGREVWAALATSSVVSFTYSIPPRMLNWLVANGSWSFDDALAMARRTPDPGARSAALRVLAIQLPVERSLTLLRETLSASRRIEETSERLTAYLELAAIAPEPLRSETLEVALADTREARWVSGQLRVITAMERDASAELTRSLLNGVLEAARKLRGWSAALALAEVANFLPDDRRNEITREALNAGLELVGDSQKAEFLAKIAPSLPAELLETAWRVAESIRHPLVRAQALSELPARQAKLGFTDEAIASAKDIHTDWFSELALARVAGHLPRFQGEELLREPLEKLREMNTPEWREFGLEDTVGDDRYWPALIGLAFELASQGYFTEALLAAEAIDDRGLHNVLSLGAKATALIAVIRLADRQDILQSALEEALTLSVKGDRAVVLEALVQRLAQTNHPQHALKVSKLLDQPDRRALAIANIVDIHPSLKDSEALDILSDVLAAARLVGDSLERERTLHAMVPLLAGHGDPVVALEMTNSVRDPESRLQLLLQVTPLLPKYLANDAAEQALALARKIGDKQFAKAVSVLADLVSDIQISSILDDVRGLDREESQARVLSSLGPRLIDSRHITLGMRAVRRLSDPSRQLPVLVGWAEKAEPPDRQTLLDEALALVPTIMERIHEGSDFPEDVASYLPLVLGSLTLHLSEPDRSLIAREALYHVDFDLRISPWALKWLEPLFTGPNAAELVEWVLATEDLRIRSRRLAAVVPYLPMSLCLLVLDHVRALPANTVDDIQEKPLAQLAIRLAGLGEPICAVEVLREIESVYGWAPALAKLAPLLPEPQRTEVLTIFVDALLSSNVYDLDKREFLVALMPSASESVLLKAVNGARGLDDTNRARALAVIAQYLLPPLRDEVIDEAITTWMVIKGRSSGGDIWGEVLKSIASVVSPSRLADTSRQLLDRLTTKDLAILAPPLSNLPKPDLHAFWSSLLHLLATRPRKEVLQDLVALSPVMATLASGASLTDSLAAIHRVGEWWP